MKKKLSFLAAITAATALASSPSFAAEMEKCRILDKEGRGLIKEHKGDCGTSTHSCAGQSAKWDPEAWIMVPDGECAKINAGDVSGISEDIKAKIELDLLPKPEPEDAEMNSDPEDSNMKSDPEDAEMKAEPEDASHSHEHSHEHNHHHSH